VQRSKIILVGVLASLAGLAVAAPARADASAWAFVGGGALGWKQSRDLQINPTGTMIVDGGVGTTPDGPVIVGGLFRFQPVMPHAGVDFSLLIRVATHGFQAGSWGVAFDVGGFARPWGYGSVGFAGSASLGMPLGVTLLLQTEVGTDKAISFGAVAGIDLLRLTVYRQTLLKWWQNPSPAWSKTASVAGLGARF
jgi:hypothetical protein